MIDFGAEHTVVHTTKRKRTEVGFTQKRIKEPFVSVSKVITCEVGDNLNVVFSDAGPQFQIGSECFQLPLYVLAR